MDLSHNRGNACRRICEEVTMHSFSLILVMVCFLMMPISNVAAIPNNISENVSNVTSNFSQDTSVSGYLEVSDVINNIGDVDLGLIANSIYNQNGVAIWQITPDINYHYISGLRFYAKLDKNTNNLSIMLSGDDPSRSLRGMIPSLNGAQNTTLSSQEDPDHYCYLYDHSKTLIYCLLKDSFKELKTNSVIGSHALLSNDPVYKCNFTNKVYIFGYYITSTEYNGDNFCYHNWPWGTGTDQCKYNPGSFICDYSTGTVQVRFDYSLDEPKNYYLYGFINNDNGEETQYWYNNNMWLHQVDYGPGSTAGEKYGSSDFPTSIMLYGHKTWSANRLMTWMAIDASSVNASGHITGDGADHVDRSEDQDVLVSIGLEKGPIIWPLIVQPASINVAIEPSAISTAPGSSANFKIKVTNNCEVPIGSINVEDKLPNGTIFISSSPEGIQSGRTIVWNDLGLLNPGSSLEIDVQVRIDYTYPISPNMDVTAEGMPQPVAEKVSSTANCPIMATVYSLLDGDQYYATQHFVIKYPRDSLSLDSSYINFLGQILENIYSNYIDNSQFKKATSTWWIPFRCKLISNINDKYLMELAPFSLFSNTNGNLFTKDAYSELKFDQSTIIQDCAHEYFHGIQNGYCQVFIGPGVAKPEAKKFITEGMARFMEREAFNQGPDRDTIKSYLLHSTGMFGSGNNLNPLDMGTIGYNAAFYWYYLENNNLFGNNPIKKVLEELENHGWSDYKKAIDDALYPQTLDDSFKLFARANYFGYYSSTNIRNELQSNRGDYVNEVPIVNKNPYRYVKPLSQYGVTYFVIDAPGKAINVNFKGYEIRHLGLLPVEVPISLFVWRYSSGIDDITHKKLWNSTTGNSDLLLNAEADNAVYIIGRVGDGPETGYVEITFQDVTPQTVTSQTETIVPSGTTTTTAPIDSSAEEAEFAITWPGSILNLSLESPSNKIINYTTADLNITHIKNSTFEYYTVMDPEPGNWIMIVDAVDVPQEGEKFTATAYVKSNLTLSLSADSYRYDPGKPIALRANLSNNGTGFAGAAVKAEIDRPIGIDNLTLYDDGTHGDSQTNDGIYSNTYTNTTDSGTYQMKAIANGTYNGYLFSREDQIEVLVQLVPDLIVSNISFSNSTPCSGDPIFINATIKNIGDANATGFAARFMDISPQGNATEIGSNVTQCNLTRDQTVNISLPWIARSGQHDIYVNITSLSLEKNETNNTANRQLYVIPVFRLSIIQAGTDRPNYRPGDNVTLYCIAENADRDLFSPGRIYAEINGSETGLTNYSTGIFTGLFNHTEKPGRYNVEFWANETGYINDSYETYFDVMPYSLKPNITVTKTASPILGSPSTNISFTINVTNTGNATLSSVKINDSLPLGLSYISDDRNASVSARNITWDIPTLLANGSSIVIQLITRIDPSASGNLTNSVEATGIASEDANETASSTAISTVKVNQIPSIPETPSGPSSSAPGIACNYSTRANDTDGDQVKYTFDWGDGNTSETDLVNSGTNANATHIWSSVGIYGVKARAADINGASSDWSIPLNVTINVQPNNPPDTPAIPSGPTAGTTGVSYGYSTNATDPDGDQVKYTFDWGDGNTSVTDLVNSNASANASHSWSAPNTYNVRAMATDSNGASSNWSNSLAVRIAEPNSAPGTPSIPSGPAICPTGVYCNYTTFAADPDGNQVKYIFDWGDGNTTMTDLVNSGTNVTATHGWSNAGTYKIKAQAIDSNGASSNWSDSLMVIVNNPPAAPSKPSGHPLGYAGASYSYSASATDPDGDPVKYTFDWGDGTNSTTCLVDSGTGAIAAHSWSDPGIIGVYQVRAKATDSMGVSSDWSKIKNVAIIKNEPPNVPDEPTGPSSGNTGIPYSFSTSGTDPSGNKVKYTFNWGDGTTSMTSLYNSGTGTYLYHTWWNAGTYQVKVKSTDNKDASSGWSSASTINITANNQTNTSYVPKSKGPLKPKHPIKAKAVTSSPP